jgi:hypothetical protein
MTDISKLTEQEATALISAKTTAAYALIKEAEDIAREHSLSFQFDVAYGMGGWFESGEWQPSSQSC